MTMFVNEVTLAEMLLETTRWYEPGVAGLKVVYAAANTSSCNWRVESFDRGRAGYDAAREAIRVAVSLRRDDWVMVPERDWRDGQIVGEEVFFERVWDGPDGTPPVVPAASLVVRRNLLSRIAGLFRRQ